MQKGNEYNMFLVLDLIAIALSSFALDYECEAGLGEFTASELRHNDGCVNTFVINDDMGLFRHRTASR